MEWFIYFFPCGPHKWTLKAVPKEMLQGLEWWQPAGIRWLFPVECLCSPLFAEKTVIIL
jgi:hypothetical protein